MLINYWWQLSIFALLSYFISNYCGAIIISNNFIHKDIRKLGSKNPGTTNMARVFGFKYGASTFIIDCFKGFACVLLARLLFTQIEGASIGVFAAYLTGLAVILGHNYPIVFGLKGGKGFASGIGVFIAINSTFTISLLLIGLIVLLIVDRMSVCALAFFLIEAIYHLIVYSKEYWWSTLFTFAYLILAIIAHRSNIIRLAHGEEEPLGILNRIKRGK